MSDVAKDVEQEELLFIADGNAKWKRVWQFLTKLNIDLLCHPAITFLDIYPNE